MLILGFILARVWQRLAHGWRQAGELAQVPASPEPVLPPMEPGVSVKDCPECEQPLTFIWSADERWQPWQCGCGAQGVVERCWSSAE